MMNRLADAFVLGFGLALSALILFMYIAGCSAPDHPSVLGDIAPPAKEARAGLTTTSTQTWSGFCNSGNPVCVGVAAVRSGGFPPGDAVIQATPNAQGGGNGIAMAWQFYEASHFASTYSTHQEILLQANPSVGIGVGPNNTAVLATCDHQQGGPCDVNVYYDAILSWSAANQGQCLLLDRGTTVQPGKQLTWTPCSATQSIVGQNWAGVGFTTMFLTAEESSPTWCTFGSVPLALDTSTFGLFSNVLSAYPTQCSQPNTWGIPYPHPHQEGFLVFWDLSSSTVAISHTDFGSYTVGVSQVLTTIGPRPTAANFQAPTGAANQQFFIDRCNETGTVDACLTTLTSGGIAEWDFGNGTPNSKGEYKSLFTAWDGTSAQVVRALYRTP